MGICCTPKDLFCILQTKIFIQRSYQLLIAVNIYCKLSDNTRSCSRREPLCCQRPMPLGKLFLTASTWKMRCASKGQILFLKTYHLVAKTWVPPAILAGLQNHLSQGFSNVSPAPATNASMKCHSFVLKSNTWREKIMRTT